MFTSFNLVKKFFITVEYDIKIELFWAGFFAGFFKVGLSKKPTGFFWVHARVSEPWPYLLFTLYHLMQSRLRTPSSSGLFLVIIYNQSQLVERKHVARYWSISAVPVSAYPPFVSYYNEISSGHIWRGCC